MNKSKQFAGRRAWFVLHVALKTVELTRYSLKRIKITKTLLIKAIIRMSPLKLNPKKQQLAEKLAKCS